MYTYLSSLGNKALWFFAVGFQLLASTIREKWQFEKILFVRWTFCSTIASSDILTSSDSNIDLALSKAMYIQIKLVAARHVTPPNIFIQYSLIQKILHVDLRN